MNVFGRAASALPIVVVSHFYCHLLWYSHFQNELLMMMLMMMISFAKAFQGPEGTRGRYPKGLPTPK